MHKGYFSAAWDDIRNSSGWLPKMCLLGLILCIPVFGAIVVMGYLLGWAREIAWNVHRPMPARIFGNEDGNLYKRGLFFLVIGLVFALVPLIVNLLGSILMDGAKVSTVGVMAANTIFNSSASLASSLPFLIGGALVTVLSWVLFVLALLFTWVGSMRSTLYGTLSSGFQMGKIWSMIRYDFPGLARILGMVLLCALIIAVVVGVIGSLVAVVGAVALGATAVASFATGGIVGFGIVLVAVLVIALVYIGMVLFAGTQTLVVRALGYWTRNFEVDKWQGQEDAMPFEQSRAASN